MKTLSFVLIVSLLFGCATPQEFMLKADASCHVADVVTTAGSLAQGNMETNPLIKALHIEGLGHVWGTVVPLAAVAVVIYYALKWIDQPILTAVDAAGTCVAVVGNLGLILR